LIIVAAAIPVFLLEGLTGSFFRPLALAYTLAIVASMVVAMTLTPALTLILLRNTPIERHGSPLVRVLQRGYTRVLTRVIRRPRLPRGGDRRRQPRRELGDHRPVRRLRRDAVPHRGPDQRVSRPVPGDSELPRRAHRGGGQRRKGTHRRPRVRP